MRNAGLEEAQAGIKIAGRNINNLRYADDTTLMHLLTPNSQFIPTPALLPFWQAQVCLSLSLFKQHLRSRQSKQLYNWSIFLSINT